MNAIIAPNTAHIAASLQPHSTVMAATIAPTTMLVEGAGKSNIYSFSSINAQNDTQGKTITLKDEEKELLDKWLNDYETEVIISDALGNQSVRFQNTSTLLMIVFLSANGVGQTDIVAYMYMAKRLQCALRYTVATVDAGRTLLTDENWNNYITLPSGGGNEWIEATNVSDTNLYNAKELYIQFDMSISEHRAMYVYCPEGLGAHIWDFWYNTTYIDNEISNNIIFYDGTTLNFQGSYASYRIFYRL